MVNAPRAELLGAAHAANAMTAPVAIVVGGSGAIGRSIAVTLASAGWPVEVWGRDPQQLRASVAACAEAAAESTTMRQVDIGDPAATAEAVTAAASSGGIGAVVWAAGAFDWAPATRADSARWRTVIDTNLTAAAGFVAEVMPHLRRAAPSALVLIGSGAGHTAYPNNAAYVASKHGLTGLARAVFLDVRDLDIKVCLISPGPVAAGPSLQSPAGEEHPERLLQPDDVADAVRYVLGTPTRTCPVEIRLQPQRTPTS